MKKEKLSLDSLKVKSFVTSIESDKIIAGDPDSFNDSASDGERCHIPSDICNSVNICFTDECGVQSNGWCRPTEECHTLQGCNSRTIP